MDVSQVPVSPMGRSDNVPAIQDEIERPGIPQTKWRWILRFAFHVVVLYLIARFSRDELPVWLCSKWSLAIRGAAAITNPIQLYFSFLLAFSLIPTFIAGICINARLMHGAARFVWLVPGILLLLEFVFHGPGMYPTMLWDSDFGIAIHYFFGPVPIDGLSDTRAGLVHWTAFLQAYRQMLYTAPVYGGISYSFGAAIGMSSWCRGLQRALTRV